MRTLLATALLTASLVLHASQEGAIAFRNLHFESLWPEGSAPVVVDATQNEKGMQRFTVQAMGRSYQLTATQLQELGGGLYNAIQVSGEGGYPEFGGRTIYIKVSMGFSSSTQGRSKFVVVTESGTIVVKDQLMAAERRASRIAPLFGAYGRAGTVPYAAGATPPGYESWYAIAVVEVESPVNVANAAVSGFRLVDAAGNEIKSSRILAVEEFERPRGASEGGHANWTNPDGTQAWDGTLPAGIIRLRIRAAFTDGQSAQLRDITAFRVSVGQFSIQGEISGQTPSP